MTHTFLEQLAVTANKFGLHLQDGGELHDKEGRCILILQMRGDKLVGHRYGEDISTDEDRVFGAGSTAQDVVAFALGMSDRGEPDDEEEGPTPDTRNVNTEDLSVEERLARLEAITDVLAEDNQRWRNLFSAFWSLVGTRE
jgi:hypothetical protein